MDVVTALVIAVPILCGAVIACTLYRNKRAEERAEEEQDRLELKQSAQNWGA